MHLTMKPSGDLPTRYTKEEMTKKEEQNLPAFEDAEAQFQEFLKTVEWPGELIWICADDVAVSGDILIVHPNKEGREQAIRGYKRGIKKHLGILLNAICRDDFRTYCAVWNPSDQTEAEYALMPQGLKFSVPSERRQAKIITGQIKWWWLKWNATPWQLK
ncbi:hypothetical protein [Geotalea daltonii]|nr:hypothetical protein [Geotalea daltonii]